MSRPKPPKGYRMDGDDYNTRSRYKGPEYNVGDSLKVILREVYDMHSLDNLQIYEIKALINALVDEHLEEVDESE